jgi:cell division protein FtsW
MQTQRSHIDILLIIAVLLLMAASLGIVYSASSSVAYEKWRSSSHLLTLHLIKVVLSVIVMIIATRIPYSLYMKITKPVLFLAVFFLLTTLALGGEVKGANRFLRFGGLGFQPSEFARFALIFHLCTLLTLKGERLHDFKTGVLPMLLWIAAVTTLVFLQPNFSTGLMVLILGMILLFIGGARLRHLGFTIASLLPIIGLYLLSAPYRMQRLLAFFNPGALPSGKNYQVLQAVVGFGNGGILGVGPGGSTQRDFFLPESYGDFIFSIVGEEYGLLGTVVVIIIFAFIIQRGFKIARKAQDDFGRYLSIGITSAIGLYALVNAGVTTHLLPTTGLPMPFISYGGSSLLFSAFAVGVLLNISTYTDLRPREISMPADMTAGPVSPVGKVY